jgi:hypothetical protein
LGSIEEEDWGRVEAELLKIARQIMTSTGKIVFLRKK